MTNTIHHYKNKAALADQTDSLASYRERFVSGNSNLIYLDGNSLGKLPVETTDLMHHAVNVEWGERLIRSWNEDWYRKNIELGNKIAPIIGAKAGEVVVCDTTSINLYKLAHAALTRNKGKTRIVSDTLNFPSDLYILQGLIKEFGEKHELVLVKSSDGISINETDLAEAIDENTALVTLSHVVFKSAFRYNMKSVTQMAHEKGALMLWDLSHSVGAVPGELNAARADLAVGCTYKYLNGGPGSPAFLYVRNDLQEELNSPIWGWFGDQHPFDFDLNYQASKDIKKFLAGTPPVLSMKAIEPTLDLMATVGMEQLRKKSILQGEFLLELARTFLVPLGFECASPELAERRGSHLAFRHPEAYRICQALIDPAVGNATVIPDFRAPDSIRFGITPLYTSFTELFLAVVEIKTIIEEKHFEKFSSKRETVT